MKLPTLQPRHLKTTAIGISNPGISHGIEASGFFDDILSEVIPMVGKAAPIACSLCASIPDPSLRAACEVTCSVIG